VTGGSEGVTTPGHWLTNPVRAPAPAPRSGAGARCDPLRNRRVQDRNVILAMVECVSTVDSRDTPHPRPCRCRPSIRVLAAAWATA